MRVLVCPTDFKENLDVRQVLEAMSAGVRRAHPDADIQRMPVSDGGPGLIEALLEADGGVIHRHPVRTPLGAAVTGRILWTPAGEAVIEAADACGLHLVPATRRDPMRGDTRGVGDLLKQCFEGMASGVVIGLGGSGTVDGGTGMAAALGFRFLGADGAELDPGGGSLADLTRIAIPPAPGFPPVLGVSDVRTVLLGPEGAARTFGPQKGASPEDVEVLERGLTCLSERLVADLAADVAGLPGSGAAGGLGAGCAAFLEAELVGGSAWVLERVGFDAALRSADLVVTGEGAYDETSSLGKVVWEVIHRSAAAGVPAVLACGRISGYLPPGVRAVAGGDRWLGSHDVERMVAEAAG